MKRAHGWWHRRAPGRRRRHHGTGAAASAPGGGRRRTWRRPGHRARHDPHSEHHGGQSQCCARHLRRLGGNCSLRAAIEDRRHQRLITLPGGHYVLTLGELRSPTRPASSSTAPASPRRRRRRRPGSSRWPPAAPERGRSRSPAVQPPRAAACGRASSSTGRARSVTLWSHQHSTTTCAAGGGVEARRCSPHRLLRDRNSRRHATGAGSSSVPSSERRRAATPSPPGASSRPVAAWPPTHRRAHGGSFSTTSARLGDRGRRRHRRNANFVAIGITIADNVIEPAGGATATGRSSRVTATSSGDQRPSGPGRLLDQRLGHRRRARRQLATLPTTRSPATRVGQPGQRRRGRHQTSVTAASLHFGDTSDGVRGRLPGGRCRLHYSTHQWQHGQPRRRLLRGVEGDSDQLDRRRQPGRRGQVGRRYHVEAEPIRFTTVADNVSDTGAGVFVDPPSPGNLSLGSSIVSGNTTVVGTEADCAVGTVAAVTGTITSAGWNVVVAELWPRQWAIRPA